MKFTADFSNYKDRFGGYVAPGQYLATIEDAEGNTSKAGNEMIVMSLRIRSAGDFQNTTLIDRFTLTDKAIFRLVNFLEVLTGKPVPRKALTIETDKWLGRQIGVEVEDREYQGRTSSNVTAYLKPSMVGGGGGGEATEEPADLPDDLPDEDPSPATPEASPAPQQETAAAEAPSPVEDTGEVDLDTLDL